MGIPSGDFPRHSAQLLMDSSTDNAVDSSNDYRFNPIKSQKNEYRKSYTNNLQMNGFAEYEVLKGLKLKVSAGYTYDHASRISSTTRIPATEVLPLQIK